ncbi:major facilitator superfamily domain-containing protein 9-like [Gigantopelta aegis]|uniref:major facilitator superfamily domain-containing protein 9-like n=1 Tax=Gigantopelta aegis TaxID=1735272 RepID=UPI001B887441|nr:major facilitator superfamily domain-containing protein 9-like [Gigantopelta aegis]
MAAPSDQEKEKLLNTQFRVKKNVKTLNDPTFVIYFSGFMDLFAVSMIIMLILPRCKELGASPTLTGIIGSAYGAVQLFSGPIIGKWSDMAGRRLSLWVCLILSATGYIMLGMATSLLLLFVARIPTGIFKHSQSISKSYLADILPTDKQAAALGRFNAMSSIGFIVGPIVGGHIAEWSNGFSVVAYLTGFLFTLNSVIVWLFIHDLKKPKHEEGETTEELVHSKKNPATSEVSFSLWHFLKSIKEIDWRNLWDVFLVKFFLGFAMIVYRANFVLMTQDKFQTTPKMNGYLISYTGIVAALSGFFVGRITKFYSSHARLLFHMSVLQALTLASLILVPSVWTLFLCLTPLSFITSVSRVSGTSLTIQRGGHENVGELIGLSQSLMAFARMLSPFVGGVALEFSINGPTVVAVISSTIAVLIMVLHGHYR